MIALSLVGIGTGNPDHLTRQGAAALNAADIILIPRKGDSKADLAELREALCAAVVTNPATRDWTVTASLYATLERRFVFAQNVRQVLDYVAREEADAGFVYATDAAIMADRVKVAFDVATTTPVRLSMAIVRDSKHAALAEAFVAYVAGGAGQQTLRRYGFRAP